MPIWEYFKNGGSSPHHRATGPFCKILFTDKSLEEGSVKGGTYRPPPGDGPLLSATSCLPWVMGISSDCKL